jgi:hypothetical protein
MRYLSSKLLPVAAAVLAGAISQVAATAPASASVLTYDLNVDACSSGCGLSSYGTVTITDIAGGVSLEVKFVNSSVGMSNTGVLGFWGSGRTKVNNTFFFSLDTAASSITDPTGFVNNPSNADALLTPIDSGKFGDFAYAFSCGGTACGNGGSSPDFGPIDFSVWGVTTADFVPSTGCTKSWCTGKNIYFALDVINASGASPLTGAIGATLESSASGPPPSVPEPGTLTLLGAALAGFGALRRRRRKA